MWLKKNSATGGCIVLIFSVKCFLSGSLQAAPQSFRDVMLENDFVRLKICPESGGRIASFYYKPTGTEMTFWDPATGLGGVAKDATVEQDQAGEYQCGKYEVLNSTPHSIQMRYPSKDWPGIELGRTITLEADSPRVRVDVSISNQGNTRRRFHYWVHNTVRVGGRLEGKDVYYYPSTKGIKEAHNTAPGKGGLEATDFVAPWFGVLETAKKVGLVSVFEYSQVRQIYAWVGSSDWITFEWMYEATAIGAGDSWKTSYYLIPNHGLSGYVFADTNCIVNLTGADALKPTETTGQLEYQLFGSKTAEVGLRFLMSGQSEGPCLGDQVPIPLKPGKVVTGSILLKGLPRRPFAGQVMLVTGKKGEKPAGFELPFRDQGGTAEITLAKPIMVADMPEFPAVRGSKNLLRVLLVELFAHEHANQWKSLFQSLPLSVEVIESKLIPGVDCGSDILTYFPATEKELANYDLILLSEIYKDAFSKAEWDLLKSYVQAGGALIIYPGWDLSDALSEVVPVTLAEGSAFVAVRTENQNKNALNGIPLEQAVLWTHVRKACLSSAPSGHYEAFIVGKASEPVVAGRKYPQGSCAVFLHSSGAGREDFKRWDFHDDLFRQIVLWMTGRFPAADFETILPPAPQVAPGGEIEVSCSVMTREATSRKLSILFEVEHRGKTESQRQELIPGTPQKFAFKTASGIAGKGTYAYKLSLTDSDGKTVAFRDGVFKAVLPLAIEGSIGRRARFAWLENEQWIDKLVFKRGDKITLRSTLKVAASPESAFSLRCEIKDEDGSVVHAFQEGFKGSGVDQEWTISNLRSGTYTVFWHLMRDQEEIDCCEKEFYLVSPIWPDLDEFFPRQMWGVREYNGLGDGQLPPMVWALRDIKEHGFNSTMLNYLEPSDELMLAEAQKLGMGIVSYCVPSPYRTPIPATIKDASSLKAVSIEGKTLPGGILPACCPLKLKPVIDQQWVNAAEATWKYAADPRVFASYNFDEPTLSPYQEGCWCELCQKTFRERYGMEMATKKKDKSWYYTMKFREELYCRAFEELSLAMKKAMPSYKGAIHLMQSNLGYRPDTPLWYKLQSILDYPSNDPYTEPFNVAACSDALWSGARFGKAPPQISLAINPYTTATTPAYIREAIFTALAHGCRGLDIFCYATGIWSPLAFPEKYEELGRTMRRISHYDVLLARSNKIRSEVAVLMPWASALISDERGYPFNAWARAFNGINRSFGQADLLFEEQVDAGELAKYKVLVVSGAEYLPVSQAEKIRRWVAQGGTLIASARTGHWNELQEEADVLQDVLGARGSQAMPGVHTIKDFGELESMERLILTSGKVILKTTQGNPFLVENTFGKGKSVLLACQIGHESIIGSRNEEAMGKLLGGYMTQAGALPTAKTFDRSVETSVLGSGQSRLLVLVNHSNSAKSGKVALAWRNPRAYVCDLDNRQSKKITSEKGRIELELQVGANDGGIYQILSEKPESIALSFSSEKIAKSTDLTIECMVSGEGQQQLKENILLDITVIDPNGKSRPEYGGRHLTVDGTLKRTIPIAANDPAGLWSLTAAEPWAGIRSEKKFMVQ